MIHGHFQPGHMGMTTMGRNCTVCMHPAGSDIDTALETGQPLRKIAARYGISKTALHRHSRAHVFGGSSTVASNTEIPTKVMDKSHAKTIAKWVLIAGLGLGALVWASRVPGHPTTVSN